MILWDISFWLFYVLLKKSILRTGCDLSDVHEQFVRDFLADEIPGDDAGGLIQPIFDKLYNDGRPFIYNYYDPKKTLVRVLPG